MQVKRANLPELSRRGGPAALVTGLYGVVNVGLSGFYMLSRVLKEFFSRPLSNRLLLTHRFCSSQFMSYPTESF